VLEKFCRKFLEDSEFVSHGCCHGAVGGAFGDATNQELSEAFPPNLATQYGLQIAGGVVKFLESYQYLDRF
jgi:hypothetical protein